MSTHTAYDDAHDTEADVVAALAQQAAGVIAEEGNVKVIHGPSGPQIIDLEPYALNPWRSTGTAQPKSVQALIDYVDRHNDTDQTTIWVEPESGHIVAVLNDHGRDGTSSWGDHRADLTLPHTPEWDHWKSKDGVLMTQGQFAEHIEEGINEIRDPQGAAMYDIATTFQATLGGSFRSATRLEDGSIDLQWTENVDARAGKAGDLQIPREMLLGLVPFYGEAAYEIAARIRYRVQEGALKIGYKLDRSDVLIRDALNQIHGQLGERFPGQVYTGAPAPARRNSGAGSRS